MMNIPPTQQFSAIGKGVKLAWLITMSAVSKETAQFKKIVVVANNLREIVNHYDDVIEAQCLGEGEYLLCTGEVTLI